MSEYTVSLTNRRGLPFAVDIRRPVGQGARPVVIVCHGLKGVKDFAFFPYTARTVCEQGLAVVTMHFSGNGIADDALNFTALDKFAQNTISQELDRYRGGIGWHRRGRVIGERGPSTAHWHHGTQPWRMHRPHHGLP